MTAADPRKGAAGALRDELKFLRGLVARPRMTGAISPSGPALDPRMASHVDPNDDLPVIELGPGTGVVTKALVERGVAQKRIIAIEYSPEFCRLIRERFPGVTVIEGDAYDLDRTLAERAPTASRPSYPSLPLVARPRDVASADRGGPRPDDSRQALHPVLVFDERAGPGRPRPLHGGSSRWIWMNIPPARVWLYRRSS